MQQMLIAMAGAGADSYWYGLYDYGSQSGSLAKNHYRFNGVSIDPDDNIYIAGQRSYNQQYYDNAIFAKLDIDGAIQAQKMYRTNTSGSYDGGGILYQRYSNSYNNSGATQESVIANCRDTYDCYWTMNPNTFEPQGQDSIKVYNKEYDKSTLCGPPTGFKWSKSSSNNTCPSIYRTGRDGYVGTIRFQSDNDRNGTPSNNPYSSNNATYVGSYRIRPYISGGYQTPYWRGIDYIDDGVMAGGSASDPDYHNVQPYIVMSGDVSNNYDQRISIGKFSGSGVMGVVWGRYMGRSLYGSSSGGNLAGGTRCDSSYSYHAFTAMKGTNTSGAGGVTKWDHNGNEQWTKFIRDHSSYGGSYPFFNYDWIELKGIDVDSSGNCYVVGHAHSSYDRTVGLVAKINANGTMGWQNIFYYNQFSSTVGRCRFEFVRLNSFGSLVIVGRMQEGSNPSPYYSSNGNSNQYYKGLVLKVAADGSGTGTYGNYTYSSTNFGWQNWGTGNFATNNSLGGGYNYQNPQRGYKENHEHTASDVISTTSM
tara:strand:- start:428 stop:2029 length:1602 start_codon:yes stop_codon:yes gene_type:complete